MNEETIEQYESMAKELNEVYSNSNFNKPYLENIFNMAIDVNARFIGILIEKEGFKKSEIIINPIENAIGVLEFYRSTYDYDLVHKFSNVKIRIANASYGDDFNAIQYELLGV